MVRARTGGQVEPLVSGLSSSLKVIGTDTDQAATYHILLVIRSNMGRIYRFRDKGRFTSKIADFVFHFSCIYRLADRVPLVIL